MSATINLACDLIRRPSITPEDHGCQALLAEQFAVLGFTIEHIQCGEVSNLWARFGTQEPVLCFIGHTDVVPTGPRADWISDPFDPTIRDGFLYGRGAADMKGSLAAMIVAVTNFINQNQHQRGSLAFLITSDEERLALDGTRKVVERLEARSEKIHYALVGEPSGHKILGDTIKNGRRGSLTGILTIHGKQGHVAYPHLAKNPFHASVQALNNLCKEIWDHGNEFFPPTSFQIANLQMGTGADNVIPQDLTVQFNLRFSTALTAEEIQRRVKLILAAGDFEYDLTWNLSGHPFLTPAGELVAATRQAIREITGIETQLSTGGGTSDGRFLAPTGAQVVECGPLSTTIHQINECVKVSDLEDLTRIYQRILELLCG